MAKVCKSVLKLYIDTAMFSINILCFMFNFSFKGDTLYRLIPSDGIDLLISQDSLMHGGYNITEHRHLFLQKALCIIIYIIIYTYTAYIHLFIYDLSIPIHYLRIPSYPLLMPTVHLFLNNHSFSTRDVCQEKICFGTVA